LVSFLVAPTFCWCTYTTRQPSVWLTVLAILPNLLYYSTNPCILVECCDATANFILKEYFMHFNPETKTYKLFNALYNGEAVTASQAQNRFGIKNISAEVSRVRQAGFAVYANSRKAGNGVQVTEYKLGKPSRRLVAAGYRALAMGL